MDRLGYNVNRIAGDSLPTWPRNNGYNYVNLPLHRKWVCTLNPFLGPCRESEQQWEVRACQPSEHALPSRRGTQGTRALWLANPFNATAAWLACAFLPCCAHSLPAPFPDFFGKKCGVVRLLTSACSVLSRPRSGNIRIRTPSCRRLAQSFCSDHAIRHHV